MSPDGSTVLFGALPANIRFDASDKRSLSRFARKLSTKLVGGRSFECLITDDAELHRLNKFFLRNDYPTDVLSFPTADSSSSLGDCAISAERALAQSLEFCHSLLEEIQILMLHGVLHLAGFDHEIDNGEMARVEQEWRLYFQLPRTLIERSQSPLETAAI